MVVTTSGRGREADIELAQATAAKWGGVYVPRRKRSLPLLREQCGVESLLVAKDNRLTAALPDGSEFAFHLGMAHVRLKHLRLRDGTPDHMLAAMRLREGMSVLDCTMGLASDAIVASRVAGAGGRVVALEANPFVAAVVEQGLRRAEVPVEVVWTEHLRYLRSLPAGAFDVVYFDPMFRHGIAGSVGISPLRHLAWTEALTPEAVAEACRVARRRVVMKENARSGEFARLGFKVVSGGRYSTVAFGAIEAREKQ